MKNTFSMIFVLIICVLLVHRTFAADDFEIRPPVLLPEKYPSQLGEEPIPSGFMSMVNDLDAKAPFYFASFGYLSEGTWFDRRLNWATFEGLIHLEYKNFGLRLKSGFSSAGRESFEVYDARASLYYFDEVADNMIRYGGGVSLFHSKPYLYQKFLHNQNFAVYGALNLLVLESKLIFLINDREIWDGCLFELKLVNPFRIFGFHLMKNPSQLYQNFIFLNAIFPFEIGLTGSFGLPNKASHFGWHVMFRYAFEFQISDNNSVGFQFYYGYKNGSSESWEIGIKVNFMGY